MFCAPHHFLLPSLKSKETNKKHFQFYLKQQLFGMNIIHQAGIIFINHCQLVSGRAHVQTAHSRGLLQQHDGKGIVNKYLQNLGILETKTPFLFLKLETAQQVQTSVLFQASHLRYLKKNCFSNTLQAAAPTAKSHATHPWVAYCSGSETVTLISYYRNTPVLCTDFSGLQFDICSC